ncbi:MAG: DsrE family protein [Methanosarcinales archaeon]|nr:DsrE family protein [ANME-2 cluster archaeon]MDW7776282.1 DsrE family protein [Methanosarcinales archaeon]
MVEITRVLLLLKNMVYESTSPQETIRFAKYYRKKGLDVVVVLWGPMGVLLGKKDKRGTPVYDRSVRECLDLGVRFKCCRLACSMIGLQDDDFMEGIEVVESFEVAEMFLEYQKEGQLIISL